MKVAIIAKYIGPTETKGARIKVILSKTESATFALDYTLDGATQREISARTVLKEFAPQWKNPVYLGQAGHPVNPSESILFFEV